jgi:hypothetical protein
MGLRALKIKMGGFYFKSPEGRDKTWSAIVTKSMRKPALRLFPYSVAFPMKK